MRWFQRVKRNKIKRGFDLPLNLIQNIRFAQAVAEADENIAIPREWKHVFKYLKKFFPVSVKFYGKKEKISPIKMLSYSHERPEVRIGELSCPIVFPDAIVSYCKNKWNNTNRNFVFSGEMYEKRKQCLQRWLDDCTDSNLKISSENPVVCNDHICIVSSLKGKEFPIKAWDDEYYKTLLNNQFVLCPDGDFVWTYRFFEAIMCGAMPVIENKCDLYVDFKYYDMQTPIKEITYSKKIAEHNFNLFKERYMFDKAKLKNELLKQVV